ncbi:pyrimidine dimer DNA glycosylase/endonuclease V [Wolbachia endosymbiont of Leptopilina clavipes]|uniref:pyrimidine dimer DNA glycosylase/endonuclease V n=1 Tax=Wolbachia endosymbiont of Leptopilina clavipes TaxID=260213 RepID=UPI001FE2746B|nr:pyrimidine dimer DNA glycosylase/endonuclease V [Wolbachia endosymbiont of Leptopilina clavipes]
MNIFVLGKDPAIAAQMLCDKHIVKMPLEAAQLLSSVFSIALETPNPFISITNQNIEVHMNLLTKTILALYGLESRKVIFIG